MNTLHNKSEDDIQNAPKEGQPDLLCSYKKSSGCPSLSLEFIPNHEAVEKVYDYLFNLIRKDHENYESNTNNRDLRQSVDLESGGSKDNSGSGSCP